MMISIQLSDESIKNAIRKLNAVQEHLDWGLHDAVEILAKDGATEAQSAFRSRATVNHTMRDETTAVITATGDEIIIAEFGAGYGTVEDHPLAKNAPVPIKTASYSEKNFRENRLHGGMFYISDMVNPGEGYWFFGGHEYHEVPAHLGMWRAWTYIRDNCGKVMSEVIKL